MKEVLKKIENTQDIREEINFNFKPEDEERLWQWWEENKDEKARLLILPYGIKMIDGEFFCLLEEYGAKMMLDGLKIASKTSIENVFFYLKDEILPFVCLKHTKANAKIYIKKLFEKALEYIKNGEAKTIYEAKIKARRELL